MKGCCIRDRLYMSLVTYDPSCPRLYVVREIKEVGRVQKRGWSRERGRRDVGVHEGHKKIWPEGVNMCETGGIKGVKRRTVAARSVVSRRDRALRPGNSRSLTGRVKEKR